jgi:hypothetical protein
MVLKLAFTRSHQTKNTDFSTPRDFRANLEETKMAKLWGYLSTVFPPVYDGGRSVWSSMYDELISHHPYFTIFNWMDACSQKEKVTTGVYLLTVQSMLMFLMAVFIDLDVRLLPSHSHDYMHILIGSYCVLHVIWVDCSHREIPESAIHTPQRMHVLPRSPCSTHHKQCVLGPIRVY